MPTTAQKVRDRALEVGLYLPLGAYARVKDQISDLSPDRVRKVFDELVGRGQERIKPLETRVRRDARNVRGEVFDRVAGARRDASRTAAKAKQTARRTGKKTGARASSAASAVAPKMPRVAAPKSAGELPIARYESLTADEIVTQTKGLTQTDLAKVYKYEKAHENRQTVLRAVENQFVALPIPTYDALTVEEIIGRLDNLSESELKTIRSYEADTKSRQTVLGKIDGRIS
jgi:hypothetical protein